MFVSRLIVVRIALAWLLPMMFLISLWLRITNAHGDPPWPLLVAMGLVLIYVITGAFSHVRRVRLIAGRVDSASLANRHRRQIEIPFDADEAFDLVEATIRELPGVENIESAKDSLQVRAKVMRVDPYRSRAPVAFVFRIRTKPTQANANQPKDDSILSPYASQVRQRNQVLATVTPGDGTSSLTLICEPEVAAWRDWYTVDHGTNLENAEAITRAISRRVAERRRGERAEVRQTSVEKELTVAKLSLLHAQVEPHFLYNTLASAQLLTRSDPPRADEMLGHLIQYLRHSLPRADDSLSTLRVELERARAYLEILKIRMGPRLNLQIDVPDSLLEIAFPSMMLQTLVENAIKHGLEPKTGGGTVWILARRTDAGIAVTVADDGRGFSAESAGTGIGLKNLRERLRLAYGDAASFAIVANFPNGVAATITVPAEQSKGAAND